jgi:hypothetical protein
MEQDQAGAANQFPIFHQMVFSGIWTPAILRFRPGEAELSEIWCSSVAVAVFYD